MYRIRFHGRGAAVSTITRSVEGWTYIAHYKIPNLISFVEEFPVTVTGKLQKFRMREMAIEKMRELSFR